MNYQKNFFNVDQSPHRSRPPDRCVLRWHPKPAPLNSTAKFVAASQPILISKSQFNGLEVNGPVIKEKEVVRAQPSCSRCLLPGYLWKDCKNLVRCRSCANYSHRSANWLSKARLGRKDRPKLKEGEGSPG